MCSRSNCSTNDVSLIKLHNAKPAAELLRLISSPHGSKINSELTRKTNHNSLCPLGCLTNLSEEGLLRLPHHHRLTLRSKLKAGHEGPGAQRQTIPPPVVACLVDGDERSAVQDHPASGGGKDGSKGVDGEW